MATAEKMPSKSDSVEGETENTGQELAHERAAGGIYGFSDLSTGDAAACMGQGRAGPGVPVLQDAQTLRQTCACRALLPIWDRADPAHACGPGRHTGRQGHTRAQPTSPDLRTGLSSGKATSCWSQVPGGKCMFILLQNVRTWRLTVAQIPKAATLER